MNIKNLDNFKISPQLVKDENGKVTSVILNYKTYTTILKSMDRLKKGIEKFKEKKAAQKK